MSQASTKGGWVQIHIPPARAEQTKHLAQRIGSEPFHRRSWAELGFFLVSAVLAGGSVVVLGALGLAGLGLTVGFVGILILAGGLRAARGLGRWQRSLARRMLGEPIDEPEAFNPRPGFFGWLRASLTDAAAWRAVGYFVAKVPLTVFGVWFALSVWLEALLGIATLFTGGSGTARFGPLGRLFAPGYDNGPPGFATHLGVFVTGVVLLFVAPWAMRLVVYLDRRMMHLL
ncbi:MAG TPA: sensor domain-containing protein, partial [Acidimicrobiales bacterium]|nr:sensor domain-containing protein [Acidimicrobiales bacterium]